MLANDISLLHTCYSSMQNFQTWNQRLKQCYITYVPHLQLTKIFTSFQSAYNINNRISYQQLWNVIITAIIVLYFWIYNVFLDLTWHFCNNIVLMNYIAYRIPSLVSQMRIYSLHGVWSSIGWWSHAVSSAKPFNTAQTCLTETMPSMLKSQSTNMDRIKLKSSDVYQSYIRRLQ